jgi:malonyl-CoA decarboxylase
VSDLPDRPVPECDGLSWTVVAMENRVRPKIFSEFLRVIGRGRTATADELSELARALVSGRGEASGVAMASQLTEGYARASEEVRGEFLLRLSRDFGPDPKLLSRAIDAYQAKPNAQTALALHNAAESRRQELIRRMNLAPGAMPRLVRMREDVLGRLKPSPELGLVDADFSHLFSSWFNRGFLNLRRIDWSTPADILEKIIAYEAVHAIQSWDDLRLRLLPRDRRCFAFFHPALDDDPLIFVEVALTTEIPDAIGPLLAPTRRPLDPEKVTTAVFYSISNCQKGLRGVSFGNFLIKQVVEELKRELPRIKTFVTLSPVPGFMGWLNAQRGGNGGPFNAEQRRLLKCLDQEGWQDNATTCEMLEPVMTRALLSYLVLAKDKQDKPLDPVARFHLGNGARLEQVHWMGDASAKGLREAGGFMVNYLYDLERIERNHERYANEGEVALSPRVKRMAQAL